MTNVRVYVGAGLMFIGLSVAFYGSRIWGGVNDEAMATLFAIVLISAFVSFVVAETEPTRKLAAGVMIGFWLGAIDISRHWWGLIGVALQAIAFAMLIIAEREASLQEEDDIGVRLYRWSLERAQERADKRGKYFCDGLLGNVTRQTRIIPKIDGASIAIVSSKAAA